MSIISGRISGGICFYKCLFGITSFFKGGIFRPYNFQGEPCKQPISYKTESNTLRSSFQEDQMLLAEHQLLKLPYGKLCFHCRHGCKNSKRVSSTSMFLMESRLLEQRLIAGSPKKRRQEKKKTVIKIMYSQKEN